MHNRPPFARSLLNAGRLSRPCSLSGLSLQTPAQAPAAEGLQAGDPCSDAPVRDTTGCSGWLLDHLGGPFTVLTFASDPETLSDVPALAASVHALRVVLVTAERPVAVPGVETLVDAEGLVARRYAGLPGTTYVIRPDAHVAARFAGWSVPAIEDAISRATGRLCDDRREAA